MQDVSATAATPFSEAGFRRLVRRTLHAQPPGGLAQPESESLGGPSDFDLNPDLSAALGEAQAPRPAAVLVPIVMRSALTVLLTQRTDNLSSHAGQICFPGGKMEPGDADPIATALREAHEEIGLEPRFVDPLGYLDAYRTGTGYHIFPVVALVGDGFRLTLDPSEVADAFEVPLAFLMDEQNHRTHERASRGGMRRFHAMPFEERYIWGVTAGIMKNMHKRLFSS